MSRMPDNPQIVFQSEKPLPAGHFLCEIRRMFEKNAPNMPKGEWETFNKLVKSVIAADAHAVRVVQKTEDSRLKAIVGAYDKRLDEQGEKWHNICNAIQLTAAGSVSNFRDEVESKFTVIKQKEEIERMVKEVHKCKLQVVLLELRTTCAMREQCLGHQQEVMDLKRQIHEQQLAIQKLSFYKFDYSRVKFH
ncbi:unnamed protein product [Caenorhabditis sp. 36 PRJEB53466]|nr:unnamed protein product [Caenorhabditis sp. 36 PRJEB53466]